GLAFLQILKGMGYYPIYIMGRNIIRNKLASKFHADKVFTSIDSLMGSDITGKADIVVEATGSNDVLAKTTDIVSPGGKILAFAVYPPDEKVGIDANKIYSKEITIMGDFINPYTMQKSINILNSGLIDYKSMADHIIGVDGIGEIFESGKKDFVKTIIQYK
ncbi:MAG: zinc-binding dehydrogenase, partial [Ferroplasma sp.]